MNENVRGRSVRLNGERMGRNGENVGRNGENVGRNGERMGRNGENVGRIRRERMRMMLDGCGNVFKEVFDRIDAMLDAETRV